ncbi:hypothetical protein ACWEGX_43665 [Streptomyces chartreusis]
MADCCGARRCNNTLTAGPGVTVGGIGTPTNPYVVSATAAGGETALEVLDTPTVDLTLTGTGDTGDPYQVSAVVVLDPAPPVEGTNLLHTGPASLYLECADVRGCLTAGDGITYDAATGEIAAEPANLLVTADSDCIALTGDGTAGDPLTATPVIDPAPGNALSCGPAGLVVTPGAVSCDDVRPCLSAGPGIDYDSATGVISAESTVVEAGTGVTVTGTGTPADPYEVSAAPPETGCGLTGDGSVTSPLAAVVAAWPYACDVDANAGGVFCDSSGALRSEPRGQIAFQQDQQILDVAELPVPVPQDIEVATRTITVNNPDACRPAFILMEGEVDADFNLPAGAGAALGIATDETWYLRNSGTAAQATKVVNGGTIPPGGSLNFTLSIRMGRGSGGATYNRVQSFLRAFVFILYGAPPHGRRNAVLPNRRRRADVPCGGRCLCGGTRTPRRRHHAHGGRLHGRARRRPGAARHVCPRAGRRAGSRPAGRLRSAASLWHPRNHCAAPHRLHRPDGGA